MSPKKCRKRTLAQLDAIRATGTGEVLRRRIETEMLIRAHMRDACRECGHCKLAKAWASAA